jgi:hypothetical protein
MGPEGKCMYNPVMKACLYVTRPTPYTLLKYKTSGGCLDSINALASDLEDLQSDKPLVLSFQWPRLALPIFA